MDNLNSYENRLGIGRYKPEQIAKGGVGLSLTWNLQAVGQQAPIKDALGLGGFPTTSKGLDKMAC